MPSASMPRRFRSYRSIALICLSSAGAVSSGACNGQVELPEPDPDVVALCDGDARPGQHPRLARLSHTQYDNSVRDLLGLDVHPSDQFLVDTEQAGFDNNAVALKATPRQARDYRRTAEALAEQLSGDTGALAVLVDCETQDEACAREFVVRFGLQVYRRPLPAAKVSSYMALYTAAGNKYEDGSPFEKGVRMIVETMLQSPHFLYRIELSDEVGDQDMIALDGYEVASRLSFLLWNTTPDVELLSMAGSLTDPERIGAEAKRMLDDDRAKRSIEDFHNQWLHTKRYDSLLKESSVYPNFGATTGTSMAEETRRFINNVVLEQNGSFADLMTSSASFVNQDLAGIYGIEGDFSDEFVQTELDPNQRAGLLTQTGFLAAQAYTTGGSPIHRGVFVQREVLCAVLPDPPGDIDFTLPPFSDDIKTTRQRVEVHTSAEYCTQCHSMINPAGFAFEHFDGVGAYRDDENGETIDTSATILIDNENVSFNGAVEFAGLLGSSPQAQRCYLTHWFRYSHGRKESSADACTIDELHEILQGKDYNVRELLVAFTQTKTFRFRAQETR